MKTKLCAFSIIFMTTLISQGLGLPAASTPIVIERLQSNHPDELIFAVSVFNQGEIPIEIDTEFAGVVNYKLGEYEFRQENELLQLQPNFVVLTGEKRVLRYFKHNLREHPSSDPDKVELEVEVKGLGKASYSFELEKPNFFENALEKIFGSKYRAYLDENINSKTVESSEAAASESGYYNRAESFLSASSSTLVSSQTSNANSSSSLSSVPLNSNPLLPSQSNVVETPTLSQPESNLNPAASPQNEALVETGLNATALSGVPQAGGPSGFEDTTPPTMPTLESMPGAVRQAQITLRGNKESGSAVLINGVVVVSVDASTNWQAEFTLTQAINFLSLQARDGASNLSETNTISVILDTIAPNIISIYATPNISGWTVVAQSNEAVLAELLLENTTQGTSSTYLSNSKGQYRGLHAFPMYGLNAGDTYQYKVTLTDQAGWSTESNTLTFSGSGAEDPYEEPVSMSIKTDYVSRNSRSHSQQVLEDLNGDGFGEIAFVAQTAADLGDSRYPTGLFVAYSDAAGSYPPGRVKQFGPANFISSAAGVMMLPVGDINGDGFTDLVMGAYNEAFLLESIDQNGQIEFLVGEAVMNSSSVYHLTRGLATFGAKAISYYALGSPGDFNGDGILDLIFEDKAQPDTYHLLLSDKVRGGYEGTNTVTFRAVPPYSSISSYEGHTIFSFPDSNGDQISEIGLQYVNAYGEMDYQVYLSPGFSDLIPKTIFLDNSNVGFRKLPGSLGDLDGDGREEHLIYRYRSGDLASPNQILYFDVTGNLKKIDTLYKSFPNVEFLLQAERVGDLNGDGVRDIAFLGRANMADGSDAIAIYYSSSQGFDFSQAADLYLQPSASVADLNFFSSATLLVRPQALDGTKHDIILRTPAQSAGFADNLIVFEQQ